MVRKFFEGEGYREAALGQLAGLLASAGPFPRSLVSYPWDKAMVLLTDFGSHFTKRFLMTRCLRLMHRPDMVYSLQSMRTSRSSPDLLGLQHLESAAPRRILISDISRRTARGLVHDIKSSQSRSCKVIKTRAMRL